jgi:phosphoribosyl-ATP pyrophosphohydrolase
MTDSIDRLYLAIVAAKNADPAASRTARLLRSGRSKMAKKLAEEAIEVVIDVIDGNTDAAVKESADLVYNLVALWVAAGIEPRQVWAEMARRERLFGIAEKLPKNAADKHTADKHAAEPPARRKVVALEGRRLRKRH